MQFRVSETLKNQFSSFTHNNNRLLNHRGRVELVFCATPNSPDDDSSHFVLINVFILPALVKWDLQSFPQSAAHIQITVRVESHRVCTVTILMIITLLLSWQVEFYGFLRPQWNKRFIVLIVLFSRVGKTKGLFIVLPACTFINAFFMKYVKLLPI